MQSKEKTPLFKDNEPYFRRRPCDAGEGMRVFRKSAGSSSDEPTQTEPQNDEMYAG